MKTSCRDRESYCEGARDSWTSGRRSIWGVGLSKQGPYWPGTLTGRGQLRGLLALPPDASLGGWGPPAGICCPATDMDRPLCL